MIAAIAVISAAITVIEGLVKFIKLTSLVYFSMVSLITTV